MAHPSQRQITYQEPRKKIVLDLDWLPGAPPGPHAVTFLPGGQRATVEHGCSVFEAGKSTGVYITTECGGKGTCLQIPRILVGVHMTAKSGSPGVVDTYIAASASPARRRDDQAQAVSCVRAAR